MTDETYADLNRQIEEIKFDQIQIKSTLRVFVHIIEQKFPDVDLKGSFASIAKETLKKELPQLNDEGLERMVEYFQDLASVREG